jgi:ubiquinone/menaquinone biosynthesis C-methylase UbiE
MPKSKPDTATQFSRQAEAYAQSATHATDADLDIVAGFAAAAPNDRCLDIACGPGHTAFRIARTADFVVATDIAPGMLATARRLAAERGLRNMAVQFADAGALPFPADTFDVVTCRIAAHHFPDVPAFAHEAARVLKPTGRLVVEDSLAPDNPAESAFLDELERRRDATHVLSLSRRQWIDVLTAAGLNITAERTFAKTHDFSAWVRRTGLTGRQVSTIQTWAMARPASVRDTLLDIEGGMILRLHDNKLILRAEPPKNPNLSKG